MHIQKCGYCGKHVAEKPILGTLHFCRTEEERRLIDRGRWQVEQQRRMIESGVSYTTGLYDLRDTRAVVPPENYRQG